MARPAMPHKCGRCCRDEWACHGRDAMGSAVEMLALPPQDVQTQAWHGQASSATAMRTLPLHEGMTWPGQQCHAGSAVEMCRDAMGSAAETLAPPPRDVQAQAWHGQANSAAEMRTLPLHGGMAWPGQQCRRNAGSAVEMCGHGMAVMPWAVPRKSWHRHMMCKHKHGMAGLAAPQK